MIKVLTAQLIPGANYCTWEEFSSWLDKLGEYQFDIETNVTQWWCTKEVKTLQFGDVENTTQYVLEWAILTPAQKAFIKESLEDWNVCKLIQNAAFEYIVMRFHGMEIHNVYCTMVAEKVLNGGVELMNYSLSELTEKYIGISMDKTLQTAFGDGILTLPKIEYAATDCMDLGEIRRLQYLKIQEWKTEMVQHPERVLELEMQALLAFSDCTYYGVELDTEKWRANIVLAEPVIKQAEQDLQDWVLKDARLKDKAIELGFYLTEDRTIFNLNAPQQKVKLLQLIFPDIAGGTQAVVKAYIRNNGTTLPVEKLKLLVSLQTKDVSPFSEYLIAHHKEYLLKEGLLQLAGSFTINWNSTDQVLALVKAVEPKLKNLSADAVAKTTHPIFHALEEYKNTLKLLTTYGETFIEKWVEPDGKVRTNYNQIVATGRSSSLRPNLQNIPSKEALNNRYRHPFVPPKGFSMVGSDFKGQELACIAHIANDEVWHKAIKNGEDLHSVTASMVFGPKWKEAEGTYCTFDINKQKCSCKGHKTLRNAIKSINFGLCYGMSKFKLSGMLQIPLKEAEDLIAQYFQTFPKIKQVLNFLGKFGVTHGYIQTIAPYFRRRQFPMWHYSKAFIQSHLAGEYNSALGGIQRQSMNQPIQGSCADMVKLAMVYVYKWIRDNNYTDRINLVLNIHDELQTVCEDSLAPMWAEKLDELMVEAGKVILPSGILKADTQISPYWTK